MLDPLPLTAEGEPRLAEEIQTMMSIVARYKPASLGGEPEAWDNVVQMEQDVHHLSALLCSVQPLVGHREGDEVLAGYERRLSRDADFVEYRKVREDEDRIGIEEASRMANVKAGDSFRNHAGTVRLAAKLRSMVFGVRGMIETLNRALDRRARERIIR